MAFPLIALVILSQRCTCLSSGFGPIKITGWSPTSIPVYVLKNCTHITDLNTISGLDAQVQFPMRRGRARRKGGLHTDDGIGSEIGMLHTEAKYANAAVAGATKGAQRQCRL